jgi:hypothetical protein
MTSPQSPCCSNNAPKCHDPISDGTQRIERRGETVKDELIAKMTVVVVAHVHTNPTHLFKLFPGKFSKIPLVPSHSIQPSDAVERVNNAQIAAICFRLIYFRVRFGIRCVDCWLLGCRAEIARRFCIGIAEKLSFFRAVTLFYCSRVDGLERTGFNLITK